MDSDSRKAQHNTFAHYRAAQLFIPRAGDICLPRLLPPKTRRSDAPPGGFSGGMAAYIQTAMQPAVPA